MQGRYLANAFSIERMWGKSTHYGLRHIAACGSKIWKADGNHSETRPLDALTMISEKALATELSKPIELRQEWMKRW